MNKHIRSLVTSWVAVLVASPPPAASASASSAVFPENFFNQSSSDHTGNGSKVVIIRSNDVNCCRCSPSCIRCENRVMSFTWSRRAFFDSHGFRSVDPDRSSKQLWLILESKGGQQQTQLFDLHLWAKDTKIVRAIKINRFTNQREVMGSTYHIINCCCRILQK